MNLYLVVPEAMDLIDHCGTDMICGHFDDLELYQDVRDADLAAHQYNKHYSTGNSPSKHVVVEMEVR